MTMFELHIPVETEQQTLLTLLAQHCEISGKKLSNNELKQAIQKGALWLTRQQSTNRLRRIKKPLNIGDTLHFYYNEKVLQQVPVQALLITDEHDYSVWYKPYGMLSQGSKWSDHCTIQRYVEQYFNAERPAFIVHRLDRAATGLMIIAHSKKVARAFSRVFEQHKLNKYYRIICQGTFPAEQSPKIVDTTIDDKTARSIFTLLELSPCKNLSLLQVKIETGRKHQIRKHAASIGLPVLGDRLHGNATKEDVINLQLCAAKLAFICPITQQRKEYILPEKLLPSLVNITKALQN